MAERAEQDALEVTSFVSLSVCEDGPVTLLPTQEVNQPMRRWAALQERKLTRDQKLWQQIELPEDLGVDCDGYKWRQNQSHVEVFVKLPTNAAPKKVTRDYREFSNLCTVFTILEKVDLRSDWGLAPLHKCRINNHDGCCHCLFLNLRLFPAPPRLVTRTSPIILQADLKGRAMQCCQVTVNISTDRLQVSADGSHLAGGKLRKTIVPSSSTWQLVDGIIEISLLKANRRSDCICSGSLTHLPKQRGSCRCQLIYFVP